MPSPSRPTCAFLTLDDPAGFVIDDALAVGPLRERGYEVAFVPWRRTGVDWRVFELVVVRSTWDYQHDLAAFFTALEAIVAAGTPLFNPLELVRWNASKRYLADLAGRGVPVVPTLWRDGLAPGEGAALFEAVGAPEIVLKPLVGANADGVFRVRADAWAGAEAEILTRYADTPLLVQPMVASVLDEGEASLIYFDGALSHAIRKTPAPRDFRVQEEHGARIERLDADDRLRRAGRVVLDALPAAPLYARVDLVRANGGEGFWLMELELVEPSLYLRMDPHAPERFAAALSRRIDR